MRARVWPRCLVRFYANPMELIAGRWRQCVRWRGHDLIPVWHTPHRGPLEIPPPHATAADLMATEEEHRPGRHRAHP